MATKKHGVITVSGELSRHLRRYCRRLFWRGERRAARRDVWIRVHEFHDYKESA